jgi:hypothetical protein
MCLVDGLHTNHRRRRRHHHHNQPLLCSASLSTLADPSILSPSTRIVNIPDLPVYHGCCRSGPIKLMDPPCSDLLCLRQRPTTAAVWATPVGKRGGTPSGRAPRTVNKNKPSQTGGIQGFQDKRNDENWLQNCRMGSLGGKSASMTAAARRASRESREAGCEEIDVCRTRKPKTRRPSAIRNSHLKVETGAWAVKERASRATSCCFCCRD